MAEVDLDWCICGKKTEGELYCSPACAADDFTSSSPVVYASFVCQGSPSNTGNLYPLNRTSPSISPAPSPTYSSFMLGAAAVSPAQFSLGFQSRSWKSHSHINVHANWFGTTQPGPAETSMVGTGSAPIAAKANRTNLTTLFDLPPLPAPARNTRTAPDGNIS